MTFDPLHIDTFPAKRERGENIVYAVELENDTSDVTGFARTRARVLVLFGFGPVVKS